MFLYLLLSRLLVGVIDDVHPIPSLEQIRIHLHPLLNSSLRLLEDVKHDVPIATTGYYKSHRIDLPGSSSSSKPISEVLPMLKT